MKAHNRRNWRPRNVINIDYPGLKHTLTFSQKRKMCLVVGQNNVVRGKAKNKNKKDFRQARPKYV